MIWDILDAILTLLEVIGFQMFFDIFLPFEKTKKGTKSYICSLGIMYILILIPVYVFYEWLIIRVLLILVIVSLVMFFSRHCELYKAVLLAVLSLSLLLVMEWSAYKLLTLGIANESSERINEDMLVRGVGILSVSLFYAVVIFLKRAFKGYRFKSSEKGTLKFIIIPLLSVLAILYTMHENVEYHEEKVNVLITVISLVFLVINMVAYYVFEEIIKKNEVIREKEMFETQGKTQLEIYSRLNEYFEKSKSWSHEYKNHMMCIRTFAENKDICNLTEYLNRMDTNEFENIVRVDTNNAVVNAVLNAKYSEAVTKDVTMIIKVNDLSMITIENVDLVIVLANLINNALEAVERIKETKIIKLRITHNEKGMIISVSNPYDGELSRSGSEFITTKKQNTWSHGIGIKNVLKVVDKYGGKYVIQTNNRNFMFCIEIPG